MAKGAKVKVLHDKGYPSKICPKCEIEKPLVFFARDLSKTDNVTSYCKQCRNEYRKLPRVMELHRKQAKEYYRNMSKERKHCIHIFNKLLKAGLVKPDKCEVCNESRKLEAHHEDYSKPFEFKWLCKRCHAFIQRR